MSFSSMRSQRRVSASSPRRPSAIASPTTASPIHKPLLVVALVLTGLSMRTAVTSVGAVLGDLEHGLHVSSSAAGLITTLPVICFAGVGSLTPRLAGRLGVHRLLV